MSEAAIVRRVVERLYRLALYVVGVGRVTVVNDSGAVQRAQVTMGSFEIHDGVPRLAEFGFFSTPPAETDALVVFVGPDRSNGVIVATNHQASRPTGIASGDSGLHDVRGAVIHLTAGGIVIDGAGLPMTIQNVGTLTVTGAEHVTGMLTADGGVSV